MKTRLVRLWHVIPGILTWGTLVALTYLIFVNPVVAIIAILIYAIYWLIKVLVITGYLIVGFGRYRHERRIDWQTKLRHDYPDALNRFYHVAIIPTYKEDISILRHTIEAIRASNYPADRIIVVVAFEAREKENGPHYAQLLTHEYEHAFAHFATTFHPADIDGEVRGKGPNITWAGREIKKYIDAKKIPYGDAIVTTLDADNRVDTNYFANLTWAYCNDPDPVHKSFQPLPMFFNNIWQVPLAVKLTALGSSFWQLIQAMRPHYCRNFSSHAQSLAALVETDFWSVKTVVEDGHQYWRSYFKFNGNHHVIPIFVPVYMDAVQGDNFYDTLREQYLQRRRWFWGVSDVPYVFEHSLGNGKIPFFYKWLQFGRLVESHYSLATQSFILLFGWLPLYLHPDFSSSVLGYNFPHIYRILLTTAWIGLVVNVSVAAMLVPAKPGKKSVYILTLVKEWVLAPIILSFSAIFFSALPAIDSQTRMLLNKPFTVFNVTKKTAIPSGVLVKN